MVMVRVRLVRGPADVTPVSDAWFIPTRPNMLTVVILNGREFRLTIQSL